MPLTWRRNVTHELMVRPNGGMLGCVSCQKVSPFSASESPNCTARTRLRKAKALSVENYERKSRSRILRRELRPDELECANLPGMLYAPRVRAFTRLEPESAPRK